MYDRKGKKEAAPGGLASHSAEGKIDEMAKLVKILTAKLNKLELEKNSNKLVQEGDRNSNYSNQFRRQFVPRFIPRERRNNDIQRERRENEDKKVPPPLQNNVVDEEEIEDEVFFEDTYQDMNYFGEQLTENFVIDEYFLNSEYYDADMFETKNDLNLEVTAVVLPPKQQSDPVLEKKKIRIIKRIMLRLNK